MTKDVVPVVTTFAGLAGAGVSRGVSRAHVDAGRWRRFGRAVVRHNGPLSAADRRAVALVNGGPRSVTTSFTALAQAGLTGWNRSPVHILVPEGARVHTVRAVPVVVHRTATWPPVCAPAGFHQPAHAAVRAAGSKNPRTAVGVLAACVQQRLVTAADLTAVVDAIPNLLHRPVLLASLRDIAMGAQALSEIDFAVLCRRARLAEPTRQNVRIQPDGTRRFLDVEWELADGRRLVVEVDGALHMAEGTWSEDLFRQNEVTIGRSVVLRFSALAVRLDDPRIVQQLRRAGVPGSRSRAGAAA